MGGNFLPLRTSIIMAGRSRDRGGSALSASSFFHRVLHDNSKNLVDKGKLQCAMQKITLAA